jgi:hypothetical protein
MQLKQYLYNIYVQNFVYFCSKEQIVGAWLKYSERDIWGNFMDIACYEFRESYILVALWKDMGHVLTPFLYLSLFSSHLRALVFQSFVCSTWVENRNIEQFYRIYQQRKEELSFFFFRLEVQRQF